MLLFGYDYSHGLKCILKPIYCVKSALYLVPGRISCPSSKLTAEPQGRNEQSIWLNVIILSQWITVEDNEMQYRLVNETMSKWVKSLAIPSKGQSPQTKNQVERFPDKFNDIYTFCISLNNIFWSDWRWHKPNIWQLWCRNVTSPYFELNAPWNKLLE